MKNILLKQRHQLLWFDGLAGASVGLGLLLAQAWLRPLYQLPANLYFLIASANLAYGCYSLTLASLNRRPKFLIYGLISANMIWALLCARWAVIYAPTASVWGLASLVAEALFVGGLAVWEWRWRAQLQTA